MKKKVLFFGTALVLSVLLSSTSAAAGEPAWRRAAVVIIDRVTWSDLAQANPANLRSLAERGAVGLLSNRTAKPETTSMRSYLTIGAGSRADARGKTGYPLNKSRFKSLVALNKRTGYNAQVGLLATTLRRRGLRVAVFGNADAIDQRHDALIFGREVELLGVDERGFTAPGDTSDRALKVRRAGRRNRIADISTDYRKLLADLGRSWQSSLVIIETGDTRRADVAGLDLNDAQAWRAKKKAVIDADEFVGKVARRLDFSRDLLIVVSPSPPLTRNGSPGQALTPIIVAGRGIKPGFLTSPSTRRAGLIAGTDIAPTIAKFFGADLGKKSAGRPVTSLPGKVTFNQMAARADEYLLSEELSTPIIFGYSAAEGTLLALVVLGLLFAKNLMAGAYQVVRLAILFILSLPLGIFIAPLLPISFNGAAAYVATILIVTAGLALIAWFLPEKTLSPLVFVTGATTSFIIINLLAGAPGDGKSAFGYTAISAGRFYGLGNHYLSVLIPAALVAGLLGIEKSDRDARAFRLPLAAFFVFIVFTVGYGGLGANTGAIIMTTPAFTLAYLGLFSKRPRWLHAIIAVATTGLAFILLSAVDAVFPSEPTHLGMLTRQVYGGAPAVFADVIKRKIMLNVVAFNYSYWSYAVIAVLATLIVWQVWLRRHGLAWAAQRHPNAGLVLMSGVAGGFIGTLANDSGIAIMAIVLGYLLMVMLYLEVCDLAQVGAVSG